MEDVVTRMTADFLKSIAHPARVKVLKMLAPGECCVCDLARGIDLEQSNLSQHLGVLKRQGLIESRKDGTRVLYRLVYPSVLEVINVVERILGEQISNSQSLLKFTFRMHRENTIIRLENTLNLLDKGK